jgi:hypothetical protein
VKKHEPTELERRGAMAAVLAVVAFLLVAGGLGLLYVAYRGVSMLKSEASHAATVIGGDAAALAGKTDWIGTWEGGGDKLVIDATGHADFSKHDAHSSEDFHGAVSFDKSDLVIDILVARKRLHVDAPPHAVGGKSVLKLDGVELEKKAP